jgi:lipid-binding SYLF domain-containing protein
MTRSWVAVAAVMFASLTLIGCSAAPKEAAERVELQTNAEQTLAELKQADESLQEVLDDAAGYAVFPTIGKGGLIIGGGYGRGALYEDDQVIGYTDMTQAAIGALIGGQTFTELIVFQTPNALSNFKTGNFSFGANASAIALNKGAAAATEFKDGVAIFTRPNQGLMADASLNGQKFRYVPLEAAGDSPGEASVAASRDEPTTRPVD